MAKKLALLFGVVFLLVGLLGFVENPLVGMGAIFETDLMHNLVHILFGVVLLVVALKAPVKSGLWLKVLGVVYLVLAVLGFLMVPEGGALLGLVNANGADHWLHIVLGLVLLVGGFMASGKGMPGANPMM